MAEYVTLLGAEEVSRAASSMMQAAAEMARAASSIEHSLTQHRQFLDDWLQRVDGTVQDRINDLGVTLA